MQQAARCLHWISRQKIVKKNTKRQLLFGRVIKILKINNKQIVFCRVLQTRFIYILYGRVSYVITTASIIFATTYVTNNIWHNGAPFENHNVPKIFQSPETVKEYYDILKIFSKDFNNLNYRYPNTISLQHIIDLFYTCLN